MLNPFVILAHVRIEILNQVEDDRGRKMTDEEGWQIRIGFEMTSRLNSIFPNCTLYLTKISKYINWVLL